MLKYFNSKRIFSIIFIVIGLILLVQTFEERKVTFFMEDQLNPMIYPRYLIFIWLLFCAISLFFSNEKASVKFDDNVKNEVRFSSLINVLKSILIIALYILLIKYLGLFISTFIFMSLFLFTFGYRNPLKLMAVSMVTAFFSWGIFEKLLGFSMPSSLF